VHLKKYLFIAIVGTLGYQTSSAQTETDAMPAKPAAERIVNEVQSVVDMATVSEVNRNASYVSASNFKGESIVKTALQYLGAKYRSGHSGPNAFDCSGLTSFVYGKEGISISRSSRTQYQEGTPITDIASLKKGDLVFFGGSRSSRSVGHVGIVTEVDASANKFRFVHAARTGVQVDDSNSAYYSRRFIGARRIINN